MKFIDTGKILKINWDEDDSEYELEESETKSTFDYLTDEEKEKIMEVIEKFKEGSKKLKRRTRKSKQENETSDIHNRTDISDSDDSLVELFDFIEWKFISLTERSLRKGEWEIMISNLKEVQELLNKTS